MDREGQAYFDETCDSWILRQIMDRFHDGIIAIDQHGRIFYVNEAYSKILLSPLAR